MAERKTYYVILAGGSGQRLWPLSSPKKPKQFLPFIDGTTLLEQTVKRIKFFMSSGDKIMVVTSEKHEDLTRQILNNYIVDIACEPIGKNTGPAVLLACLKIHKQDPEARVVILPSDHFIPDQKAFASMISMALLYVSRYKKIALFGISPTYPATGYGYIQTQRDNVSGWSCFPLEKFHEKPDEVNAHLYLTRSDMLWNVGIFVSQIKTFIGEFSEHAQALYSGMMAYQNGSGFYGDLPKVSIDHAVIEKSKNLVVFPATFHWSDVGSIATFLSLQDRYQKSNNQIISINGQGNLAMSTKKTVAFIGVSNVCVVETDDVIAIVSKHDTEGVRDVQVRLSERERHG